ncbi:thiamine ABC transporter substrate binding subunit [Chelativorans sp. ZYF759]|uniref:thiamine ABC transporter substrate binding subunit n=1 Tax=Chelativorans sp. ZYF759 TaxID=2692213 RepID=UPI00145F58AB|nr:thiamine ABC transporter substrate binding subunit [Chelativorans sp. ZYF759]NMG40703.1 thiamine ABC transporter substrate binding subunit [Chelativorans sp. ZYF759]
MRAVSLFTSTALALAIALPAAAQDILTIYTYDSFTSDWGPGPVIEAAFEAECGCEVNFVAVADGVALLNRLRLEGQNTQADIVLGLDTNLVVEAKDTGLFVPHDISLDNVDVPGGWEDDIFVPYDYGYFAFVYDTEAVETPPASLRELVEGGPEPAIVIQDPRTSTPGLGLMLWVKHVYGDEAEAAWAQLSERVVTVTPGWSESYGLFTSGEVPMVLSYTTSPAYHIIAEETERYQAAAFEEGHYMQIELAGITTRGQENPLARQFMEFMTGPGFQDAIPETNWMYPAGATSEPLNPAFDRMVAPSQPLLFTPEEVAENRRAWVDEWLSVMSR